MEQVYRAGELAAGDRAVLERLLRRSVDDNEVIGVRSVGRIVKEAPEGAEREDAIRKLLEGIQETHKHFENIPADELEELIEEAIAAVRHGSE
jgi:hypothetical protein